MALLIGSLNALEIEILPSYCIDGNSVHVSDIDKQVAEDRVLFDLPQNSTDFSTPTIRVSDFFKKNGYDVIDTTRGVITFKRFCDTKNSFKPLHVALERAYKKQYSNIKISSLNIEPKNPLPSGFNDYEFINIQVSKSRLRRGSGIFITHYENRKNQKKTLYFYFKAEAHLPLFKANHKLSHGNILTQNDYKKVLVPIDKIPTNPLQIVTSNTLVAKFDIKKDTILSNRQFKKRLLLQKGSMVMAILRDGNLVLQTEAKALSGGNRGDIVRVRTNEGKVFNALVKNSQIVLIR